MPAGPVTTLKVLTGAFLSAQFLFVAVALVASGGLRGSPPPEALVGLFVVCGGSAVAVPMLRRTILGDVALQITADPKAPQRDPNWAERIDPAGWTKYNQGYILSLAVAEAPGILSLMLAVVFHVGWLVLPGTSLAVLLILAQLPSEAVAYAATRGIERAAGKAG